MSDGIRSGVNAFVVEAKHRAQRLHEARLGEARHTDEERMAAGEQRDQGEVDDAVLTEDDGRGGFPYVLNFGADFVQAVDQLRLGFKCRHGSSFAQ
jgi:hypothetical protein